MKILKEDFFARDTKLVAKELLGKYLVNKDFSGIIVETEAYDGLEDKASHAFRGRTKRTEVMFGQPGRWYIYLCYGMYYMLNVVTRESEYPAAVLIRGVKLDNGKFLNGPGKVTRYFKIDKSLNTKKAERKSGLWVEDRGVAVGKKVISSFPRVGVAYAGPIWSKRKLRFFLDSIYK